MAQGQLMYTHTHSRYAYGFTLRAPNCSNPRAGIRLVETLLMRNESLEELPRHNY